MRRCCSNCKHYDKFSRSDFVEVNGNQAFGECTKVMDKQGYPCKIFVPAAVCSHYTQKDRTVSHKPTLPVQHVRSANHEVFEIANKAKQLGMSYGEYVARGGQRF